MRHLLQWPKSKNSQYINGENVEQQELSFTARGNAKWYNHFERQFGSFLEN